MCGNLRNCAKITIGEVFALCLLFSVWLKVFSCFSKKSILKACKFWTILYQCSNIFRSWHLSNWVFLKFQNIHKNKKTLVLHSLFNKVADLQVCNSIKKRLRHRCFPVNVADILRTTFFIDKFWWLLLYSSTLPSIFWKIGYTKYLLKICLNPQSFNCKICNVQKLFILLWDHSFSQHAKFSQKLTLFTPCLSTKWTILFSKKC